MLFFKKKDKEAPSDEKKAARAMPRTKKVQFLPMKLSELTELLNSDLNAITGLEPVNYYASKDKYIQCTFYFTDDYSEVYLNCELYENDFMRGSTPYYKADYELMKKTVIKFGQRI